MGRPTNEERARRNARMESGESPPGWQDQDQNDSPSDAAAVAILERSAETMGLTRNGTELPNQSQDNPATASRIEISMASSDLLSDAPQTEASAESTAVLERPIETHAEHVLQSTSLTPLDIASLAVSTVSPNVVNTLLEVLCANLERGHFDMLFRRLRGPDYNLTEPEIWKIMQFLASRTPMLCHNLLRHNAAITVAGMRTTGRGIDFNGMSPPTAPALASHFCQGIAPARKMM